MGALIAQAMADAVTCLVSDQAKWITGLPLPVDAGFCVR
jgi:hypothetical protein